MQLHEAPVSAVHHDGCDIAGDGRFAFTYRDHSSARSVRLLHGLAGYRIPPAFSRIGRGVFGLDFHAPAVNRIEYKLQVIDAHGRSHIILDPANPLKASDPFGEKSVRLSQGYSVPLHVAPPPLHAQGTLSEHQLPGSGDSHWPSWLWRPPNDDNRSSLPLLIFLDGGDYLRFSSLRNILENLICEKSIEPCRAIFISPASAQSAIGEGDGVRPPRPHKHAHVGVGGRNDQYSANPETAIHLTQLLPQAIQQIAPVPSEPRHRIGIGASLGGLCLLHAHFTQPGFFGKLLLQSGSFFQPETDPMETGFEYFDRIASFVHSVVRNQLDAPGIQIEMTCGRGGENLANNRIMAQALRQRQPQRGYNINITETADAHNWTSWRDCIGQALTRLMSHG